MVQAGCDTPQAVAEAVHAAQPFLKCHRPLHAGTHQLAARLGILTVARGTFNVCPAASQPIQRDTVGGRVEGG